MKVTVRVTPGANATQVGGRYGDTEPAALLVRVQARAVDGKANGAVLAALAQAFRVARRDVRVVAGHASRTKVVEIDGGDPERLVQLLASVR